MDCAGLTTHRYPSTEVAEQYTWTVMQGRQNLHRQPPLSPVCSDVVQNLDRDPNPTHPNPTQAVRPVSLPQKAVWRHRSRRRLQNVAQLSLDGAHWPPCLTCGAGLAFPTQVTRTIYDRTNTAIIGFIFKLMVMPLSWETQYSARTPGRKVERYLPLTMR